jgi:PAS domain S-box-containing protein
MAVTYVALAATCAALLAMLWTPESIAAAIHSGLGLPGTMTLSALLIAVIALLSYAGSRLAAQDFDPEVAASLADLQLLEELNQAANRGESRDRLLSMLASGTQPSFHAMGATVYLLEPGGAYLTLASSPRPLLKAVGLALPAGVSSPRVELEDRGWYESVISGGQALTTDDFGRIVDMAMEFEGSSSYASLVPAGLRAAGIRAVMTAPISYRGNVIGVIDIGRSLAFDDDELERFGVIADELGSILSRVEEEQQTRQREQLYRTLAESSQEAIFVVDAGGRALFINQVGLDLLGVTMDEARESDPSELLSANDWAGRISHALETHEVRTYEDLEKGPDGNLRQMQVTLVPLGDAVPGGAVLGVARDVTALTSGSSPDPTTSRGGSSE